MQGVNNIFQLFLTSMGIFALKYIFVLKYKKSFTTRNTCDIIEKAVI